MEQTPNDKMTSKLEMSEELKAAVLESSAKLKLLIPSLGELPLEEQQRIRGLMGGMQANFVRHRTTKPDLPPSSS